MSLLLYVLIYIDPLYRDRNMWDTPYLVFIYPEKDVLNHINGASLTY